MQDLDRITLSKDADVRVLDNNFLNVKNAVDAVENSISDESARAIQKENAISNNAQQNTANINIHTNQIAELQTTSGLHTQQISALQENLADYIGAFDNKADLDAYSGTLSNNDWAVVLDDETHSNQCWRYIYRESTTSWEPQFMVNEKPLTQAQLNAINSGIDSTKVAQIATNTSDIANKQDALVSGTNIKTINNKSILGSGNINIQGGSGGNIIEVFSEPVNPDPTTLYVLTLPSDYNGLKLTAKQDNSSIGFAINGTLNIHVQYSTTNGFNWIDWDGSAVILNKDENICIRNTADILSNENTQLAFTMTGEFEASGDISSMINFEDLTPYCFKALFGNCQGLTKAPDLPSTNLATGCYSGMFGMCPLTDIYLPAIVLAEKCYENMFMLSSINSIKVEYTGNFDSIYFNNWLFGAEIASTQGTLYYNGTDTTRGASAVPTNWVVQSF